MASIFNKTNNLYENPKRNTFDMSFQNNLTLNFGELTPCLCLPVIPGDTAKIDPTMALKMLPTLFPVQTRVRAHVHFFYVTNRSLWKDWMDFIGNTKDNLELPYLAQNLTKNWIKTGSIYDYMGLPTTLTGVSKGPQQFRQKVPVYSFSHAVHTGELNFDPSKGYATTYLDFTQESETLTAFIPITRNLDSFLTDVSNSYHNNDADYKFNSIVYKTGTEEDTGTAVIPFFDVNINIHEFKAIDGTIQGSEYYVPLFMTSSNAFNPTAIAQNYLYVNVAVFDKRTGQTKLYKGPIQEYDYSTDLTYVGFNLDDMFNGDDQLTRLLESALSDLIEVRDVFITVRNGFETLKSPYFTILGSASLSSTSLVPVTFNAIGESTKGYFDYPDIAGVDTYGKLKINALPFRAYEAIYNSFYRDDRNNPLIINGEPVYNKYLLNDNGGADYTQFTLRKRNWEADFLTTAVQSPQQGVAPLVGITSMGEISFKDVDTGEVYTAQLNASDGDTIDSFHVTSTNMPKGNLKQLVDFASSGISISDLRGVNSLQRWLEINMRRGLRYKDQIMSHFGVDVKYDELLMPEFIGGFSEDIYINQINQTSNEVGNPLGSFAGQGGAFGSSKHSITHYCQEHGYIIGIISIAPVANYSQLLPKDFLKRDLLDYFFPEFGHLSMQAITYNEVCPLNADAEGRDLNDTFGYQRAWYDYLARTDEVHGLFRTTLRNFVINRVFDGSPELSPDFLTIDHKDLDDIFAVTSSDSSHKFMGQIYFDIKMKRPIPEYGIPKLEV